MASIGIDVGGTTILGVVVDNKGKIIAKKSIATEAKKGKEKVLKNIKALIRELLGNGKVKGIGIGIAGLIDHKNGVVVISPNLTGWKNVPLKKIIEKEFSLHVKVANDVNAFSYGEWKKGAGIGTKNLFCLTLGTGVGGGLIIDSKLYVGNHEFAGEIGHTVVVPYGRKCPCGGRGCLERYIGVEAIVKRAKALIKNKRSPLTPFLIAQMAKEGNPIAIKIWKDVGEFLAIALVNVMCLIDPEKIVIGGGIAKAGKILFNAVKNAKAMVSYPQLISSIEIVSAKLGHYAGAIGAALLSNSDDLP